VNAPARTASVGVDVDSLRLYYRIHGLDDRSASNAAWRVGVARFEELFAELGIRATFFCVAEDVDIPGNTERIRRLVADGHEIGNHTWRHPYALTRLPEHERRTEVQQGRFKLEDAAEAPVVGFRSPGYNADAALQTDVLETGHRYDSSVFPCVPYYAAKAAIMGLMRLRGRESQSILGTPRVLAAPRSPYVASREDPHVRGQDGLIQFPISVFAGVPLIGTAFTAIGERASAFVADLAARASGHLTIEFHAADLLSLRDDGLDPALAVQPDLRVPVDKKRRAFRAALKAVQAHAQVVRLADLNVSPAA
jgi:hypothetical protein